ncbi:hypothetical protein BDCR2A_01156 [Borrelia duttonii CR2A]|uniref:Uncharacterized protein n=1 Tax=Borrelia duttonii CR2A TaxID=1432657 RepID=W6TXT0_9SPIR|nr:hypothetical protein BDCR2A_01156 [Borrelia duttonii CR2A]
MQLLGGLKIEKNNYFISFIYNNTIYGILFFR